MNFKNLICGSALAFAALAASALEYKTGAITVVDPHARATAAGQPTGGGFMKFVNRGRADRLVSVSADVSKSVELHTMTMEGDVMRMRQVDAIELPAGKTVELAPGAYHIMFVGLKAPLKAGGSFPLTLKFQKAGAVTVAVKIGAGGAGHGMKH